jgi:hypothetical protein
MHSTPSHSRSYSCSRSRSVLSVGRSGSTERRQVRAASVALGCYQTPSKPPTASVAAGQCPKLPIARSFVAWAGAR